MASFTLDDIRAAAEAKYGSTDIEVDGTTVSLVNPLRLPKTKRDALQAVQQEMNESSEDGESVDQVALIQKALRLVAERDAEVLIDAIGDDLAVLVQVFEAYGTSTQLGEASASAD